MYARKKYFKYKSLLLYYKGFTIRFHLTFTTFKKMKIKKYDSDIKNRRTWMEFRSINRVNIKLKSTCSLSNSSYLSPPSKKI